MNVDSPVKRRTYQVKDIAGFRVETESGECLGTLVDVYPTGGNDVFVVLSGTREYLIPARSDVVRSIEIKKQRILVDLPKGLRDIYEAPPK